MAAGCTSVDDKNDYVDAVNRVQETAVTTLNQSIAITGEGDVQRQLENAAETMDGIVSDLQALDVPEEAEDGHRALTRGYEELQAAFATAARDAEGADTNTTFEVMESIKLQGDAIGDRLDIAVEQLRSDLDAG